MRTIVLISVVAVLLSIVCAFPRRSMVETMQWRDVRATGHGLKHPDVSRCARVINHQTDTAKLEQVGELYQPFNQTTIVLGVNEDDRVKSINWCTNVTSCSELMCRTFLRGDVDFIWLVLTIHDWATCLVKPDPNYTYPILDSDLFIWGIDRNLDDIESTAVPCSNMAECTADICNLWNHQDVNYIMPGRAHGALTSGGQSSAKFQLWIAHN